MINKWLFIPSQASSQLPPPTNVMKPVILLLVSGTDGPAKVHRRRHKLTPSGDRAQLFKPRPLVLISPDTSGALRSLTRAPARSR